MFDDVERRPGTWTRVQVIRSVFSDAGANACAGAGASGPKCCLLMRVLTLVLVLVQVTQSFVCL